MSAFRRRCPRLPVPILKLSGSRPMSNIAERIERIPFSRFHWQLLFIGGVWVLFDGGVAAGPAFLAFLLRGGREPGRGAPGLSPGGASFLLFFFARLPWR